MADRTGFPPNEPDWFNENAGDIGSVVSIGGDIAGQMGDMPNLSRAAGGIGIGLNVYSRAQDGFTVRDGVATGLGIGAGVLLQG